MKDEIRIIPLVVGIGLVVASIVLLIGVFLADEIFPEYSPAHRGQIVALKAGCFSCHGPGEGNSSVNPTKGVPANEQFRKVPSLFHERQSSEELRQWIEDGIPETRKNSERFLTRRESHALKMPAYKDVLNPGEIDDLITYVALMQYRQAAEKSGGASEGERLARRYACFTCHGELGQGGVENQNSLKGYIPGFFGTDFRALARNGDRQDLREWILDGYSQVFYNQGFAGFYPGQYFMNRQGINMPAYKEHMTEAEVETLVDYLIELMQQGPLNADDLMAAHPIAEERREGPDSASPQAPSTEDLFTQAASVLEANCVRCHGPDKQRSSYRLDSRERALRGGEIAQVAKTVAILPGDPNQGLLTRFIAAPEELPDQDIYPMPPGKNPRLSKEQIELLRSWIAAGVPWPDGIVLKAKE